MYVACVSLCVMHVHVHCNMCLRIATKFVQFLIPRMSTTKKAIVETQARQYMIENVSTEISQCAMFPQFIISSQKNIFNSVLSLSD